MAEPFLKDPLARGLLADFERGRLADAEFERRLAAALELDEPAGLIDRLFAGLRAEEAMQDAVTPSGPPACAPNCCRTRGGRGATTAAASPRSSTCS